MIGRVKLRSKNIAYAKKRNPEKIENWLKTIPNKVIRLDGTKPIHENVGLIKASVGASLFVDKASDL